ncbi:MAG: menaquinone biosynthetic enzyme MqnA/MqnD family protein [Candidatus Tectimicrobiota bacterium]
MPITVGHIPYLSYEPFYFVMQRRDMPLRELPPSAIAEAALRGDIDAGPIPLSDCARLQEQFRYLSGFCVATYRKAISVVLHAQQPIESLQGARIALSSDAAMSVQLLRILLVLKHQLADFIPVTMGEPHAACLLIGNEGLRQRHGRPGYPHLYDLGQEWSEWTRLPCVYSRWMVRKDLERTDVLLLEDALYTSLQDWADGLYHSSPMREDLYMHPRDIHEYTQGIRYFIGVPEQRGMERFHACLEQLTSA